MALESGFLLTEAALVLSTEPQGTCMSVTCSSFIALVSIQKGTSYKALKSKYSSYLLFSYLLLCNTKCLCNGIKELKMCQKLGFRNKRQSKLSPLNC